MNISTYLLENISSREECNNIPDEPSHHRRYRVAWHAFKDPDTPKSMSSQLMEEMDSAQNHFKFDEFQEFKKTLVGFEEYWSGFARIGKCVVEHMKSKENK